MMRDGFLGAGDGGVGVCVFVVDFFLILFGFFSPQTEASELDTWRRGHGFPLKLDLLIALLYFLSETCFSQDFHKLFSVMNKVWGLGLNY